VLIFRSDLGVSDPRAGMAALIVLLSPLSAAVSNVAIKRWGGGLHVYNLTTLPMAYGAVALGTVSFLTEDFSAAAWTARAVGSILYLAVLGSVVAFVVYYSLLKQVAVSTLALISYVFPVVAVALGWAILGERLDATAAVGTAGVVAGIALASWRRRRAPIPPVPEGLIASDEGREIARPPA